MATTLYPNPRRNKLNPVGLPPEALEPADVLAAVRPQADPNSQAVIQANELKRIRRRGLPPAALEPADPSMGFSDRMNSNLQAMRDAREIEDKQIHDRQWQGFDERRAVADAKRSVRPAPLLQLTGADFAPAMTPEQLDALQRGGQRIDAAGPYSGGLADSRMTNLAATGRTEAANRTARDARFDAATKAAPQTQDESYDQINARRAEAGLPPVAYSKPGESGFEIARQNANENKAAVADKTQQRGMANQTQNAEAAKTHNLQRQAEGLATRMGIPVAQALMMIQSGMTQPAGAGAAAGDPDLRRQVGNALLYGQQGAAQLEQGRQGDAIEGRKLDQADKQLQMTSLQNYYAARKAARDAERARSAPDRIAQLDAEDKADQAAYMAKLAELAGLNGPAAGPGPNIRSAINDPSFGASQSPGWKPPPAEGGTRATPVSVPSSSSTNVGPIGRFPAAQTDNEVRLARSTFQPSFEDLWAAAPFRENVLGGIHQNNYKPLSPWIDSNKDGVPQPNEVGNSNEDLRYYLGKTFTAPIIADLEKTIATQGEAGVSSAPIMYQRLKAMHGNVGEDAIRWAMARAFDRPEWISDISAFKRGITDRPTLDDRVGRVGESVL